MQERVTNHAIPLYNLQKQHSNDNLQVQVYMGGRCELNHITMILTMESKEGFERSSVEELDDGREYGQSKRMIRMKRKKLQISLKSPKPLHPRHYPHPHH